MKTIKIDDIEYNLVPVDPPFNPNVGEKIEVILSSGARKEFRVLNFSYSYNRGSEAHFPYSYPHRGSEAHFSMQIDECH